MTGRIRRAATAIEFALVLPVLLILVSGIADYGWFLSQQVGVTEATREAARAAATAWADEDPGPLAEAAAAEVLSRWAIPEAQMTVRLDTDPVLGRVVEVTVTAPFQPLLHLVPSPETLGQSLMMRTEWQPPPAS